MELRHLPWVVLGGHAVVAVLYGVYLGVLEWQQAHREPGSLGPLACGNNVVDPLLCILNWGPPLALASWIWLMGSCRTSARPSMRVALASVLFAMPTAVLLGFAIWYFHGPLRGSFRIAKLVWWVFGV